MATQTKSVENPQDEVSWIAAEKDYKVALVKGKLICQNPKGKQLASVPKWLKDGEPAQQLIALRDWLVQHETECRDTLELWMLRSLPIARTVLASIWPDPSWSGLLKNMVVCAMKGKELDQEEAGFLRDVDAKKGVGIVDLDGETQWIKSELVALPHPILLEELNDFRALTVELEFQQALDQLFRQTWKPDQEMLKKTAISEFSQGKFEQLNFAFGACRTLGYRVRGGSATCPVWENGRMIEARYWIGADAPEYETWTGELIFTDEKERSVLIGEVGPVAFSEGMRMASAIYAKRSIEKDDEDED